LSSLSLCRVGGSSLARRTAASESVAAARACGAGPSHGGASLGTPSVNAFCPRQGRAAERFRPPSGTCVGKRRLLSRRHEGRLVIAREPACSAPLSSRGVPEPPGRRRLRALGRHFGESSPGTVRTFLLCRKGAASGLYSVVLGVRWPPGRRTCGVLAAYRRVRLNRCFPAPVRSRAG
jgi:hypothetical protein